MSYTPSATQVDQPADNGVPGASAPAEFRTIKLYMRDVLLAGIVGKLPVANPVVSGQLTTDTLVVNGASNFNGYAYGVTPPPGDSSKKLATTEFLVGLALGTPFPGATSGKWKEVTSDGSSAGWGFGAGSALSVLNYLGYTK